MDLCDMRTVQALLARHGFTFSKAMGQNFLIDPTVCPRMAEALQADEGTGVLEIGPGVGVLTKELSAVCGRVVAVELDRRLPEVLRETLAGLANVRVLSGDILQMDLQALFAREFSGMHTVKVCANLPYYITSPVLMRLLESRAGIEKAVVMVQREAAVRLAAPPGTRDCGAVSAAVSYYAEPRLLFDVGREAFYPSPHVDSAVMCLDVRRLPAVQVQNEAFFFRVVKGAFAQRRKTLPNSLSASLGCSKAQVTQALSALGLGAQARAEQLTLSELGKLADGLYAMGIGD